MLLSFRCEMLLMTVCSLQELHMESILKSTLLFMKEASVAQGKKVGSCLKDKKILFSSISWLFTIVASTVFEHLSVLDLCQ